MESEPLAAPPPLRWDAEEDGVTLLPLRLRAPLRWRDDGQDERIDLATPAGERRLRRANWLPFLVPISEGASLVEVVRRAQADLPHRTPKQVRFLLNRILTNLDEWDLVEFELPPMPDVLAGRYRILRSLGRGGAGFVWEAADLARGGASVAVKHAWNGTGPFASRDRALRREHATMSRVDHPGIVKALDGFEVEGRFHLVRDLLDGAPLSKQPPEAFAAAPERIRATARAADVVAYLLDEGLFYLDLKPSNFYRTSDGRIVLGDVGGVKPYEGERRVRGTIATIAYCAPEMFVRAETDERGLVYALGLLHWRLVTGRRPRPKAKSADLVAKLPPGTTDAERTFLTTALATAPADRFASIRDASRALEGRA